MLCLSWVGEKVILCILRFCICFSSFSVHCHNQYLQHYLKNAIHFFPDDPIKLADFAYRQITKSYYGNWSVSAVKYGHWAYNTSHVVVKSNTYCVVKKDNWYVTAAKIDV